MPAKCWDCGETGHVVADCPNRAAAGTDGRPPWCGICDEHTRLMGIDEMHRCPVCHPLGRKQLRQHRKCPQCHVTVYEWDTAPCGRHASPAVTKDTRPTREHIDAIVTAERDRP